ncbi:MAG: tandem-95 repeat protein [Acidobacteria bacterium]|nr:tandem-95 repeat protein [Acidobacteriota bacterium]
MSALVTALVFALCASTAQAQRPAETTVSGIVTAIHVDQLDRSESGGSIVVGTQRVLIPPGLPVQMPGGPLTFTELFTLAPARCLELHESGLVPADGCRRPPRDDSGRSPVWTIDADRTPRSYLDPEPTDEAPPTIARVTGVRGADGVLTAAVLSLNRTDTSVWGAVTFVNEDEGYLRVNGALGVDAGGALLRINDPEGRQSVQQGTGCGQQGNCSPDVRFKANTATATVRFEAGYTACIPGGLGTACQTASRPIRGLLDGNAMVPILVGDHVTAQGGFEVHNGVRVFWAHTLEVHTSPAQEP